MANEWLTQLMAGLGGAFTGATAANERIGLEQERERKRMETENERQRLQRIQQLRGGGFSEASARELLSLGESPQNIAALQELFTPTKAKPRTQYDPLRGGIVNVDEGTFRQIPGLPSRPSTPRETGPTKEEEQIGGAWLTNWLGTADPEDRMRRSTLFNQMRKQGVPYGQIGWSLMQAESAGGRQMGQTLRNRRAIQSQQDDEFNDIEF
jgi:DNA-binding transcriptional MerR regulator